MAKPQITDASLVAARQVMNEHLADVKNPHDVNAFQTGAVQPDHKHTKSGLPDKCSFSRASTVWWKNKQLENHIPRLDYKKGILVEEGTTNLLPAGAENFVTGWASVSGATVTVTPNQLDPWGGYTACRIRATGGTDSKKYQYYLAGLANPHTVAVSVWALKLPTTDGGAYVLGNTGYENSAQITSAWSRLAPAPTALALTIEVISFSIYGGSTLDILVCQPQIENKPYATSYTPPGTTRAAESMTIPVNAHQKNLLTPNQATGGDTLGDTTGFTAAVTSSISRDTTVKYSGSGCIKCITQNTQVSEGVGFPLSNLIIGKIYTVSVLAEGSFTGNINAMNSSFGVISSGPSITLNSSFAQYIVTFAATTTTGYVYLLTSSQQSATFYIDGLQLEEGTTASDWALPEVDYSNAVLNPMAGTIECDVIVPAANPNGNCIFNNQNNSSLGRLLLLIDANRRLTCYVGSDTIVDTLQSSRVETVGDKIRVGVKYSSAGTFLYLDGVIADSASFPAKLSFLPNISIGSLSSGLSVLNSTISNLRISKIARTDTEMAYTGTLDWDDNTTFLSQFTGEGGTIKHSDLLETGTNTHAQIDTALTNAANHLANTSNPHGTTAAQVGAVPNAAGSTILTGFNTVLETGQYTINTATDAPGGAAYYYLEVIKLNSNFIVQKATHYTTGFVWQRILNNGVWSGWSQILPAVATAIGVGAVPNFAEQSIAAGFNTITASGQYFIYSDQANAPAAGVYWYLEVISYGAGYGVNQVAYEYTGERIFRRRKTNTTWSAWVQIYPAVYQ